jgi:hypothetical protein
MKRLLPLIGLLLLASCNLPLTAVPPTKPPTPAPSVTPTASVTVTSTTASLPCYFVWASQNLPDITAELQAAIQAILPEAAVRATAFGENCVAQDGSSTFSALETDFYVTIPVADLQDNEAIGATIGQVLEIVDGFIRPRVPGPNDGFVEFTFASGSGQRVLRVPIPLGKELREKGLRGAALLAALETR